MSLARKATIALGGDWHGTYGTAPSPGHSKADRGLSITDTEDGQDILINSHNGGDWQAAKDELRDRGILPPLSREAPRSRESGRYEYVDENGVVLYRTVRIEKPGGKEFVAQRPDGKGGWTAGIKEVRRIPYRLPELLAAPLDSVVYIVEGERKADTLAAWGFTATAVAFGANGGWRDAFGPYFNGRTVAILPDNDDPGRDFAEKVRASIASHGGKAFFVELPGLPPKGDIVDWKAAGGTAEELRRLTGAASLQSTQNAAIEITATPFGWPDPATVPLRPWVLGRELLRGTITGVIAGGGSLKSTYMVTTALSLVTGRALLGKTVWDGPQRVWFWNLEDPMDELDRMFMASAIHYGIGRDNCGDRLFVDSGLTGQGLCTATEDATGFRIIEPVYEALAAELERRDIDVLIVDPFVSSHQVSENDNNKIDAVSKRWAKLATECGCAIVLVHHTRKLAGQAVTAEAGRGAVALINTARTVLVFNRMSKEEGERFGITDDADRRLYVNVLNDKLNRAPPAKADWIRAVGVHLGNGGIEGGDSVAVAVPWTPPDAFEGIDHHTLRAVQSRVADGQWRANVQSTEWVGIAVADAIGADIESPADKQRVKELVKGWIKSDVLREIEHKDDSRRVRKFVRVGTLVDSASQRSE